MSSWLHKLRATELHRLAVLLGTPCSGTKAVQVEGIEGVLKHYFDAPRPKKVGLIQRNQGIRLFSIDMGVKNLAYAFFTTTGDTASTTKTSTSKPFVSQLRLEEWQKFDISAPTGKEDLRLGKSGSKEDADTHAYHPSIYASRAYRFVETILQHKPTHIIIERQRFRSGGGPAVQEWSIRVGVFEAMLWAMLHTLTEQRAAIHEEDKNAWHVESILPTRVNQFWFQEQAATKRSSRGASAKDIENSEEGTRGRLSGKEMKKAKIKLVVSLLDGIENVSSLKDCRLFEIGDSEQIQSQVEAFQQAYEQRSGATMKSISRKSETMLRSNESLPAGRISKLDDLSDCLLQGVAWWNWRNNRIKVATQGETAFDLRNTE